MAIAWDDSVKSTRKLTYFVTKTAQSSSVWGRKLIKDVADTFQKILDGHSMDLTLEPSKTAPDTNGMGGANIQIDISVGSHSYTVLGTKLSGKMPPSPIGARTHLAASSGTVVKAYMFLPTLPTVSTPSGPRGVGKTVREYILLHELVHAFGLEDGDPGHNTSSTPDIFRSYPAIDFGDAPDAGRGKTGDVMRLTPDLAMPPFFMAGPTASLITSNWG